MNSTALKSVEDFAGNLINIYVNHFGKGNFSTDPWSCCICGTVLVDPVTLVPCGHSVCKRCVRGERNCRKCDAEIIFPSNSSGDGEAGLNTSILISEIVEKLWAKEKRAVQLRNEGNKLFQRGEVEASIERYTQAFELSPEDHIITSNRSHAYMKINKQSLAVQDAKYTVAMRPDWGKGYFRLGRALSGQDNPEEALVAFFHCLVLEQTCSKALRAEIVQEFCKIMFKEESRMELESGQNALDSCCSSQQDCEVAMEIDTEDQGDQSLARNLLPRENKQICSLLVRIEDELSQITEKPHRQEDREIVCSLLQEEDFNCPLCLRLLWQPLTTSCGHTFCRTCIERNLDHRAECPMCKASLQAEESGGTWDVNEFVEQSIKRLFPLQALERQNGSKEEQLDDANIPIFVCTTSFPKIPCPLHVFEPRHRLMIRRVMEAGTREFGMCSASQDRLFSDYGTMLEIRGIQYFEDGQSVLETLGGRRFRVVERDTRDGYQVAKVEFLEDDLPSHSDLRDLQLLHDQTHANALSWLRCHHPQRKEGIITHFGMMPPVEENYWLLPSGPTWLWWLLAILPLDSHAQTHILSQCLLKKRLSAVNHILGLISAGAANHCD